ncbi:nuclear transport factor 2 family protein [Rufibacter sediminis]|uniref:Nuclear transport factor 2 family protein n=1 Tax=Rufibacter sediminis TaxID=2762756 RepID=A0ABR6VMS7_9BACT|nr:nuclear transport factor 2 family protein [Rufibacter sediminis]MBC3538487.1 nuclear transport factor 2 family protein [Rufibacter sediminis]
MDTKIKASQPKTDHGKTLRQLLESFNGGADKVVRLFHPQATIEFPYAHSLGTPELLPLPEYHSYLKHALQSMPVIEFSGVKTYQTTDPDVVLMEAHGEAVVPATGQLYQQDYFMVVTFKEGKIFRYKEYWNTLAIQAFGGAEKTKEAFNHK